MSFEEYLPAGHPLFALCGNAPCLVSYLDQHRDLIRELADIDDYAQKAKPYSVLLQEGLAIVSRGSHTVEEALHALRIFKYREVIRIACQDLRQEIPFEDIGRQTADVASVALEMSVQLAISILGYDSKIRDCFCVLGLGKLGGSDLNFSSDVDIQYLFQFPQQSEDEHEFVIQIKKIADMVTHLMQQRTSDGIVYRVDLDLRPEGKNGPLVNSLEAILTYYEVRGAPWERSALIKARAVAGNPKIAEEFSENCRPFVYPRSIDAGIIKDLKAMKAKIDASLPSHQRAGTDQFHLKLGRGGIREVEFFVSAFQLIYGGHHSHHSREGRTHPLVGHHTLDVLKALGEMKIIPVSDEKILREGYIFLRRVENRVQMKDERQTHVLPQSPEDVRILSRQMGYNDPSDFLNVLAQHTAGIAACFDQLNP